MVGTSPRDGNGGSQQRPCEQQGGLAATKMFRFDQSGVTPEPKAPSGDALLAGGLTLETAVGCWPASSLRERLWGATPATHGSNSSEGEVSDAQEDEDEAKQRQLLEAMGVVVKPHTQGQVMSGREKSATTEAGVINDREGVGKSEQGTQAKREAGENLFGAGFLGSPARLALQVSDRGDGRDRGDDVAKADGAKAASDSPKKESLDEDPPQTLSRTHLGAGSGGAGRHEAQD